jgi:thiol peroxidase
VEPQAKTEDTTRARKSGEGRIVAIVRNAWRPRTCLVHFGGDCGPGPRSSARKERTHMATIKLKGNPVETSGTLPAVGSAAPEFSLLKQDLARTSLTDFPGKKVLNIFPSVDTAVCASSVRKFNEAAAKRDVQVICISEDLPFALKRFCGAEGIDKVTAVSGFRSSFGKDYGLEMTSGPLAGLMSRAVVVLDVNNKVLYAEQVPDITQEPNYDAALAAL